MNVVFLGPPGAGKGTLADPIRKKFEMEHFSTGDMLRREVAKGSPVGIEAKKLMDAGKLVPDEIVLELVRTKIAESDGSILFDGFPRTVAQAEALQDIAGIDAVIYIYAPIEEIVARICSRRSCPACGKIFSTRTYDSESCDVCGATLTQRDDDTEETVRKRYDVYVENTSALIDYYKEKGLLHMIESADLDDNIAEVAEILRSL